MASLDSSSATGGVLELPGDDYFIYGRGASQRCELRVPVHEHAGLCQQVADEHKVKARNATLRLSPVFAVCCVCLFWGCVRAPYVCALHTLNCPSVCESIHVFDACVSIPAAISKPQDSHSRLTTLHRRVRKRNKRAGRARAHVHTKAGREKAASVCVPCLRVQG